MPGKAKSCAALFNAHRGAAALYKAAVRVRDSQRARRSRRARPRSADASRDAAGRSW